MWSWTICSQCTTGSCCLPNRKRETNSGVRCWRKLLQSDKLKDLSQYLSSALINSISSRLNGCYEALTGGNLAEALVDITGGVPETVGKFCPFSLPN